MNQAGPDSSSPRDMLCIVLSFNGYADTAACLDSLKAEPASGFDILVVDNASQDGVVSKLTAAYPDVELVALAENRGWAGGNNVGIRIGLERGYRWICLLNNDTVFPAGQVQAWMDATRAAPPCLLHPSIYYWDEPGVAQLHPGQPGQNPNFHRLDDGSGLIRMSYAYGACLAVAREVFERVGLFDERFFLQLEETDFHMRATHVDYHALCNPSVKIFHKESRAFGGTQAAIKTYYSTRNTLLLIEKNRHGLKARLNAIKHFYWSLSELAASTERHPLLSKIGFVRWLASRAPSARAVRSGVMDYLLRRFGKAADTFREELMRDEKLHAKELETRPSLRS
jgi:GT2 family glycosyltransferase